MKDKNPDDLFLRIEQNLVRLVLLILLVIGLLRVVLPEVISLRNYFVREAMVQQQAPAQIAPIK